MTLTIEAVSGLRLHPSSTGELEISVHGPLDDRCGRLLVQVTGAAPHCGTSKITIDLRGVQSFTDEGVAAAVECCRAALARFCGFQFVAAAGPPSDALLAILDRQ